MVIRLAVSRFDRHCRRKSWSRSFGRSARASQRAQGVRISISSREVHQYSQEFRVALWARCQARGMSGFGTASSGGKIGAVGLFMLVPVKV